MNVTRNGQTVAFEVNAAGDLEQTSPYTSKAGDPNREYVAYRVEDVIVIAQDKFLARQALKQHRVELAEAMRAELDAAEAAEAAPAPQATTVRTQDRCPRCNRLIALHADGTFYPHGPRARRCRESGQEAGTAPSEPVTTAAAPLTTADIERMHDHENWHGFGYLGERSYQDDAEKVAAADAKALDAANRLGLTYEQLFDWANSKVGRWFGDCMFGSNGRHAEKYVPGGKGC